MVKKPKANAAEAHRRKVERERQARFRAANPDYAATDARRRRSAESKLRDAYRDEYRLLCADERTRAPKGDRPEAANRRATQRLRRNHQAEYDALRAAEK